ncbi:variant erythrocyte surface antigen-1 family protein [Babesia caballi]|uniref:Variant erythrocyte surface antigen-1 family protein n=1 Tax=Babesia caballi TaxID=5871 RepID=A0AAV4LZH3_BABCB|nr:variant erythrocyte surface antigen-1 family protein [Babesia caballi]
MGAQSTRPGSNGPYDSLTKKPTNLKEAIDWVLRFSGRDKRSTDDHEGAKIGADAVKCLADEVVEVLKKADYGAFKCLKDMAKHNLCDGSDCNSPNAKACLSVVILQNLIDNLIESLSRFIGYDANWDGTITGKGIAIGRDGPGSKGKPNGPSKPWGNENEKNKSAIGYVLAYNPKKATWKDSYNKGNGDAKTCADNFMTAVTIIFEKLTKLYFDCRIDSTWSGQQLNINRSGRLYEYLFNEGFREEYLNTLYVPEFEILNRNLVTGDPKKLEGLYINGLLGAVFGEFGRAMVDGNDNKIRTKNSGRPLRCSYDAFINALMRGADESFKHFNKPNYGLCSLHMESQCDTSCNTLPKNMAIVSSFDDYPFTKLYILAAAYRRNTDQSYKSVIFKTLGAVTCGAGLGTAAYFTNAFGLLPVIASVVS